MRRQPSHTFGLTKPRLTSRRECKRMTKVTIGVCVRNGETTIGNAISSIIDQSFPHELMEAIFVDDGSEDKTLSVIQDYVPKMGMNVEVISHEWKGLGVTRNTVVNKANGEYIVWVDSDMVLTRDFVRKQVKFMDDNPDVGIAKGRYGLYDSSSLVAYLENVDAVVKLLDERNLSSEVLGTGGCIYRVQAIRNVGGFDENLKSGEDADAENRIRKASWLLKFTSAEFFELRRMNWHSLWNEYFWHGVGGHQIFRKVNPHSLLYRMFPPVSILTEIFRSCAAYKLVHKKVVFLLPLHWIFKRTSWCLGFGMCNLRNSRMT
jgi:glycosyltransferase involved in cell wall biosynthesis